MAATILPTSFVQAIRTHVTPTLCDPKFRVALAAVLATYLLRTQGIWGVATSVGRGSLGTATLIHDHPPLLAAVMGLAAYFFPNIQQRASQMGVAPRALQCTIAVILLAALVAPRVIEMWASQAPIAKAPPSSSPKPAASKPAAAVERAGGIGGSGELLYLIVGAAIGYFAGLRNAPTLSPEEISLLNAAKEKLKKEKELEDAKRIFQQHGMPLAPPPAPVSSAPTPASSQDAHLFEQLLRQTMMGRSPSPNSQPQPRREPANNRGRGPTPAAPSNRGAAAAELRQVQALAQACEHAFWESLEQDPTWQGNSKELMQGLFKANSIPVEAFAQLLPLFSKDLQELLS